MCEIRTVSVPGNVCVEFSDIRQSQDYRVSLQVGVGEACARAVAVGQVGGEKLVFIVSLTKLQLFLFVAV
jgi:hypothetical protein